MINNKGQSIVVFVLIMPIIFLLIGILWEIGNQYVLESEYESEIKNAITYGLKTNNKEDLENKLKIMLDKNLEGTKEISISDDKIKIHVSKKSNSIFKKSVAMALTLLVFVSFTATFIFYLSYRHISTFFYYSLTFL